MANIPLSDATEPGKRQPVSRSRWVPWMLAAFVLMAGFGLGALYAAGVSVESSTVEPAATLDDIPLVASETAGEPVATAFSQADTADREPGPTEVAFVANFPLMDFDWETVTIPTDGDVDFRWFGRLGNEYAAVALKLPESGESQHLATWTSADGRDWNEVGALALPAQTSVNQVVGSNGKLYAIGETWSGGTAPARVAYTSVDGIEWTEFAVPDTDEGTGYSYVQGIAASDKGIILALTVESYPPEPPQVINIQGFTIEIDHRSGSYTVTDSSGTDVAAGPVADIWHWQDDGQGIYNPDTGDLITTVPWQVWEQGWNAVYDGGSYGSPLPIPIEPTDPYIPPPFVVEWDGLVITLDEQAGVYEVTDAESGSLVAGGPADYIWRGPPPSFFDSETGELILSVTWEEWDKADSASWEQQEEVYYGEGWYHTDTIILFSADGSDWEETTMSSSSAGSSVAVVVTEEGFVLNVTSFGQYGETRSVWTSEDGIEWEITESADGGGQYLHSTVPTADGYRSIGDGPGGQGVLSSPDGLTWETAFTVGPQDDGRYVWLSTMAHGPLGTVVAGTKEEIDAFGPLTIAKDGLTAEFEGEFIVRITDDSTGEELLALSWGEFESGGVGDQISYEDGETRFFDRDGNLVMAITDDEAREGIRVRDEKYQSSRQQVLFIEIDGEWFEVEVDAPGVDNVNGLVVGDSQVLLGGMDWGDSYPWESEMRGGPTTVLILIGTPAQ